MKVEIFILTHKEINEKYDESLYKPILTGAVFKNNIYNYLTDDCGDNISELNEYFGEITGEYWAWKNSENDIIGFSQRRRFFVKNFRFEKLTKMDIINDLKKYDIILPYKFKRTTSLYDYQKEADVSDPDYDIKYDDYVKIEEILKQYYPEYGDVYSEVMNGKWLYTNNMFICKREIADKYFEWLFNVYDILMDVIDLKEYEHRDKRIFGFISERLLTTFVVKNKLNVKEYNLYSNESSIPHITMIERRHPRIRNINFKILPFIRNIFKFIGVYK